MLIIDSVAYLEEKLRMVRVNSFCSEVAIVVTGNERKDEGDAGGCSVGNYGASTSLVETSNK